MIYTVKSIFIVVTVNVNIFTQDIFSRISHRVLDAQTFDVSEKLNHDRTNRIDQYVRGNFTTRKCLLGPDARKFINAKISSFTVSMLYYIFVFIVYPWYIYVLFS